MTKADATTTKFHQQRIEDARARLWGAKAEFEARKKREWEQLKASLEADTYQAVWEARKAGSIIEDIKHAYGVSNSVSVTIRDIAKSGPILDAVVSAGANQVNGISFDVSDRKTPSDAALKAAIADAIDRGTLMADAAGVKLVRVLSVSTAGGNEPTPVFARMALKAAPPVPVMPGQQTLSATATIAWEIAPK